MKGNIKGILAYLVSLLFVFVYSFSFAGKSLLILYMVLLGGILEVVSFLLIKSSIDIEVAIEGDEIEKDEVVDVNVRIKNHSFLPSSKIEILLKEDGHFIIDDSFIETLVDAKEEETLKTSLRGLYRGVGKISLEKVLLRSYLGLFYFDYTNNNGGYEKEIRILPKINSKLDGEDLTRDKTIVLDALVPLSEEIILGEPSYDFKEYAEGDSLSMVNWKLSAKKNSLIIRERERLLKISHKIILSPNSMNYSNLEEEDLLIEGTLALCKDLISKNLNSSIEIYEKGKWTTYQLEDESVVLELQRKFSLFEFNGFNIPYKLNEIQSDELYIFSKDIKDKVILNESRVNLILPAKKCLNTTKGEYKLWRLYNSMEMERVI